MPVIEDGGGVRGNKVGVPGTYQEGYTQFCYYHLQASHNLAKLSAMRG